MSCSLVYLHIPKSAGTSHRGYLLRVFGEKPLFWYGEHSDAREYDAKEVGSSFLLGGHRPIAFYPRSLDALYTSVVREPVERVVSFFNYCAGGEESNSDGPLKARDETQKRWRLQGLDPLSLTHSIESCDAFRREISNLQCSYLSRYEPTFEGVLKTLEEENMVIGVFDKLQLFNDFLKTELNFHIENRMRVNVGREGYSPAVLSEPGVIDLIRSLNVEDQRLYDFLRLQRGGLYVGAQNISTIRSCVPALESRSAVGVAGVSADWNRVQLFSKGILQVDDKGVLLAPLVIRNVSNYYTVLSSSTAHACSIGWQMLSDTGAQIESMRGIVQVDETIPAGELKMLWLSFSPNGESLRSMKPVTIEFCIVADGEWLNEKYPLSSAWSRLILSV